MENKDKQFLIGFLMTLPFLTIVFLSLGFPLIIKAIEGFPLVLESLVERWDRWVIVFSVFGFLVLFFIGVIIALDSYE